jgi:hypothetical protein
MVIYRKILCTVCAFYRLRMSCILANLVLPFTVVAEDYGSKKKNIFTRKTKEASEYFIILHTISQISSQANEPDY